MVRTADEVGQFDHRRRCQLHNPVRVLVQLVPRPLDHRPELLVPVVHQRVQVDAKDQVRQVDRARCSAWLSKSEPRPQGRGRVPAAEAPSDAVPCSYDNNVRSPMPEGRRATNCARDQPFASRARRNSSPIARAIALAVLFSVASIRRPRSPSDCTSQAHVARRVRRQCCRRGTKNQTARLTRSCHAHCCVEWARGALHGAHASQHARDRLAADTIAQRSRISFAARSSDDRVSTSAGPERGQCRSRWQGRHSRA